MGRTIHAMVIEDSAMTRKMIMRDLSATGLAEFEFAEASDGLEALEKYPSGQWDLLFVDMQMPRMDGIEFLQQLRATQNDCPPAGMITSENSKDLVERAIREARVDGFMLKPVDADRLRGGLKKLVDSLPDRTVSAPSTIPYGQAVPESVIEVLSQTCQLEIQPCEEDAEARHGEVLLAGISILGELQWSVVVGYPRDVAVDIVGRFAGFPIPADSPDMADALSELANQVAGRIKHRLCNQRLNVEISLPVVHEATAFRTLVQRGCTREYRHFTCQAGPFWTALTVGITPGLVL